MKKIIFSLAIIAAAAAVVIGGTIAYFSDTETSTGNTFSAGSLDLRFQADGKAAPFADVNGAALFDTTAFPLLSDMKPGDKGERTVKLWVDNNPSCGTVGINVTEDKDNLCTEPELVDESGCKNDDLGELNDQVNFAVWADPNCNNILDTEESILVHGPLTGSKVYSIGELPISEATAKCYGIAYCFGTWNGTSCDGSIVNNASQTDSFKADIIINALQKRNQYDSGCPQIGELNT
jgi:predicted ribosomally synthesized peptide with SipW-like signal peptide